MTPAAQAALTRMLVEAGGDLRNARLRRGWTLHELADRAGVAASNVHRAESGGVVSLETHARISVALGLEPTLAHDWRTSRPGPRPSSHVDEDFVHAAMGELEAGALARPGRTIAIDEPYQHYQFAGRADVLVWERDDLLHIENRTRFPNIQEAAGSWNAKRQYLARALADRLGIGPGGWRSVTHVMACLWSAEVIHVLRIRHATFTALCPDGPSALDAWLAGGQPPRGAHSTLLVLDPAVPFGSRQRTIASALGSPNLEPRYRGYADAAKALRRTS